MQTITPIDDPTTPILCHNNPDLFWVYWCHQKCTEMWLSAWGWCSDQWQVSKWGFLEASSPGLGYHFSWHMCDNLRGWWWPIRVVPPLSTPCDKDESHEYPWEGCIFWETNVSLIPNLSLEWITCCLFICLSYECYFLVGHMKCDPSLLKTSMKRWNKYHKGESNPPKTFSAPRCSLVHQVTPESHGSHPGKSPTPSLSGVQRSLVGAVSPLHIFTIFQIVDFWGSLGVNHYYFVPFYPFHNQSVFFFHFLGKNDYYINMLCYTTHTPTICHVYHPLIVIFNIMGNSTCNYSDSNTYLAYIISCAHVTAAFVSVIVTDKVICFCVLLC